MSKRLTRAQVSAELTWNLADLFTDDAAWEAELAAVAALIPSLASYRGRLGEGAATLRDCLGALECLSARFWRMSSYAGLKAAADGADPKNQADQDRVYGLAARLMAEEAVIRAELLALPAGVVEAFVEQDADLTELKPYLTRLTETRPHMLSQETEFALASLAEVLEAPSIIYERAKQSDIRFAPFRDGAGLEVENAFALYEEEYEKSADVTIRRNAFDSFTKGLTSYKNTLAATFATDVKRNVVMARLRKYPSATAMLLRPHQVTEAARDNLLDIIQTELSPHMRRYAGLRRRVLGLDSLRYCDLEAPLDPDFTPRISFAEGRETLLEALAVFGPEYSAVMRRALTDRWCDLADNEGKMTGAFCSSPYGAHSYILMTWTDSMAGLFTLAHELGHAGHFELANKAQRLFNTEPSLYFVEAPSTLNELLLGEHLLARSSEVRVRRWVLMNLLATYHHNFVRHLLEGELQRRIYQMAEKDEPITEQALTATKGAILERFWGDAVQIDEGARLTWMRQPHYYMGLYPYTYSAGLTLATAFAVRLREEGAPAARRWLDVLRAGGTRRPLELAAMAGVDMSQPDPIRKAVAYVGRLVAEVEESFGH